MMQSVARVHTGQPERYVKQLVSHLGHRLSTELLAPGHGIINFDDGRCMVVAEEDALVLTASADDLAALARIQDVVGRHLERFGTRAELRVQWPTPT